MNRTKEREDDVNIELDLQVGLVKQFPKFKDLLMVVVYSSRPGLMGVAAALDVSPSVLSRMLKTDEDDPDQKRHLPADYLPLIIETTGDLRPIHWLIEQFVPSRDTVRKAALDRVAQMIPHLMSLIETAEGDK